MIHARKKAGGRCHCPACKRDQHRGLERTLTPWTLGFEVDHRRVTPCRASGHPDLRRRCPSRSRRQPAPPPRALPLCGLGHGSEMSPKTPLDPVRPSAVMLDDFIYDLGHASLPIAAIIIDRRLSVPRSCLYVNAAERHPATLDRPVRPTSLRHSTCWRNCAKGVPGVWFLSEGSRRTGSSGS